MIVLLDVERILSGRNRRTCPKSASSSNSEPGWPAGPGSIQSHGQNTRISGGRFRIDAADLKRIVAGVGRP